MHTRKRSLLVALLVVVAGAIWFTAPRLAAMFPARESSSAREGTPAHVTEHSSTTSVTNADARPKNDLSASVGYPLQVEIMSREPQLYLLTNNVRQTSDPQVLEYAVVAPRQFCSSFLLSRNQGAIPLVESKRVLLSGVVQKLDAEYVTATARLAERCRDFASEETLQNELARAPEIANLPLVAAFRKIPAIPLGAEVETIEQSLQLFSAVFERSNSAVAAQLLANQIGRWSVSWAAAHLPESYRVDSDELAAIAVQIAGCRLGAPCEDGTIARDAVCAKYRECQSKGVEAAYRRLHELYEVPYSSTELLVNRYVNVFRDRTVRQIFAGK